jgi:hypothetical protein
MQKEVEQQERQFHPRFLPFSLQSTAMSFNPKTEKECGFQKFKKILRYKE